MILKCKGWNGIRHECTQKDLSTGLCPICTAKLESSTEDYKDKIVFRKKPARMGTYDDGTIRLIIDIPKLEQWKINEDHEYIIFLEW